jgi:hypothetical protein
MAYKRRAKRANPSRITPAIRRRGASGAGCSRPGRTGTGESGVVVRQRHETRARGMGLHASRGHGDTSIGEEIEIESFDGVRKIIHNSAVPIRDANERITAAVVVNEDISANKAAERALNDSSHQMRTLTASLMRAQDNERRRIAQMLHETTAQNLPALKMLLARLKGASDRLNDREFRTFGARTPIEAVHTAQTEGPADGGRKRPRNHAIGGGP